jgi:hypothetical protein
MKVGAGLIAALVLVSAPLSAQRDEPHEAVWQVGGLERAFCVLFLVDSQLGTKNLPAGLKLVSAGAAEDLHPALKREVDAQPELAAWIPSHLCFYSADSVRTTEYVLRDKGGRRPQLIGLWTVSAAETASGAKRDVALLMVTTNSRLVRSGHLAGQSLHEVTAKFGKVVNASGEALSDNRFQVKIGKTLVTWDGRRANDSSKVTGAISVAWSSRSDSPKGQGELTLSPVWAYPMVGALKIEGKDDLGKALKASPVRFVGPMYRGGDGEIRLRQ